MEWVQRRCKCQLIIYEFSVMNHQSKHIEAYTEWRKPSPCTAAPLLTLKTSEGSWGCELNSFACFLCGGSAELFGFCINKQFLAHLKESKVDIICYKPCFTDICTPFWLQNLMERDHLGDWVVYRECHWNRHHGITSWKRSLTRTIWGWEPR